MCLRRHLFSTVKAECFSVGNVIYWWKMGGFCFQVLPAYFATFCNRPFLGPINIWASVRYLVAVPLLFCHWEGSINLFWELKVPIAGVCLICGSHVLGSASFPSNPLVVVDVGGYWEQKVMYGCRWKGEFQIMISFFCRFISFFF